jgi:peptide/nickel transport system substrate-binding protein
VKAGVVGAGAVAAGSMAGAAAAAPKRIGATPKKGGKLTFALEQDPVHIAPFGAILPRTTGARSRCTSPSSSGTRSSTSVPALAESWKVVDPRTVDFTLKRGVRFHNGKEVTAADVKYSVEGWLNPPLPARRRPSTRSRRSSRPRCGASTSSASS